MTEVTPRVRAELIVHKFRHRVNSWWYFRPVGWMRTILILISRPIMLGKVYRVVDFVENENLKWICDSGGGWLDGNKLVRKNKDQRHNCLDFTQPVIISIVHIANKGEDRVPNECLMAALWENWICIWALGTLGQRGAVFPYWCFRDCFVRQPGDVFDLKGGLFRSLEAMIAKVTVR